MVEGEAPASPAFWTSAAGCRHGSRIIQPTDGECSKAHSSRGCALETCGPWTNGCLVRGSSIDSSPTSSTNSASDGVTGNVDCKQAEKMSEVVGVRVGAR